MIQCASSTDQFTYDFFLLQAFLEGLELLYCFFVDYGALLDWLDAVDVIGDGEDVKFIIHYDAILILT